MKVQEAVENNQDIMDSREMKAVRNEIMKLVVGGVFMPNLSEIRELSVENGDAACLPGCVQGWWDHRSEVASHLLDGKSKVDKGLLRVKGLKRGLMMLLTLVGLDHLTL